MSADPSIAGTSPAAVAAKLRELRIATGMRQFDLARALGISVALVSSRETGRNGVSVSDVAAWADACGVAFVPTFVAKRAAIAGAHLTYEPDRLVLDFDRADGTRARAESLDDGRTWAVPS